MGIDFATLRSRVIYNSSGNQQLPITNSQLTSSLYNLGYTFIKDVDNITNRIFLATKKLPVPISKTTTSGAGFMIGTIQGSHKNFSLADNKNTYDNGNRLTLSSDVLYEQVNGVTKIVPIHQRPDYIPTPAEGETSPTKVGPRERLIRG